MAIWFDTPYWKKGVHITPRIETSDDLKEYSDMRNNLYFPVLMNSSLGEYCRYLLSQYKETYSCNSGVGDSCFKGSVAILVMLGLMLTNMKVNF